MMFDLMTHLYEYTRIIVLKENINGQFNRSKFSQMTSHYIGYTLMVLVLKYYSMMINTTSDDFVINKNKFDILETFNKNFPVFTDIMYSMMAVLIGENIVIE